MSKNLKPHLYHLRTASIDRDLNILFRLITSGKSILEVGCGTGRIMRFLSQNSKQKIVGVDVDNEKIEYAKETLTGTNLTSDNFINIDFLNYEPLAPFENIIFAFNVLAEFTSVKSRISALKHAEKILAKGGQILLIVDSHNFSDFGNRNSHSTVSFFDGQRRWKAKIDCQRNQVFQTSHCSISYLNSLDNVSVEDAFETSLLTRNEVLAIIAAAGLNIRAEFGSFDLTPVDECSTVLIYQLISGE